MGQPVPKPWTVAEFLDWERKQPERYEFVDGVIRMMTGGKWVAYQGIPSLQHYPLVPQDEPRVDVFTRDGTGWRLEVLTGLDARIPLPAIDCTLSLMEIYEEVRF